EDFEHDREKAERARELLPVLDYIPPAQKDWSQLERAVAAGAPTGPFVPGWQFRVDRHVEQWLDRTLDLAARERIPVFVALSPVWDKKCFYPPNREFLRRLTAWLEEESQGGARFERLWNPVLAVESRWLGDKAEHLSLEAKRGPFTLWFAARLRDALEGRPSALPAGRVRGPFRGAGGAPARR